MQEEVDQLACQRSDIPILRRCSGGGTVLQGPGCLNYSLILPIDYAPQLITITGTNQFVLSTHAHTFSTLLGQPVTVKGITDLAVNALKFSGNAQRRKRHKILFHGTVLLKLDLGLVQRILRPPPRQPAYRKGRSHTEFLTQLNFSADQVKQTLCQAWEVTSYSPTLPDLEISRLVAEKYSCESWNFKR